jgi:hypothetical protein
MAIGPLQPLDNSLFLAKLQQQQMIEQRQMQEQEIRRQQAKELAAATMEQERHSDAMRQSEFQRQLELAKFQGEVAGKGGMTERPVFGDPRLQQEYEARFMAGDLEASAARSKAAELARKAAFEEAVAIDEANLAEVKQRQWYDIENKKLAARKNGTDSEGRPLPDYAIMPALSSLEETYQRHLQNTASGTASSGAAAEILRYIAAYKQAVRDGRMSAEQALNSFLSNPRVAAKMSWFETGKAGGMNKTDIVTGTDPESRPESNVVTFGTTPATTPTKVGGTLGTTPVEKKNSTKYTIK